MSEFKLIEEILKLSTVQKWDVAKLEWSLKEVYEEDEPCTCLCGHYPIIEICTLENRINKELATVGNCCVKKFIGLPSDKIFQAVKRVRKDREKSLNAEAIKYAFDRRWINKWENDFYLDIKQKRNLSDKQLKMKIRINEKMARFMKNRSPSKVEQF